MTASYCNQDAVLDKIIIIKPVVCCWVFTSWRMFWSEGGAVTSSLRELFRTWPWICVISLSSPTADNPFSVLSIRLFISFLISDSCNFTAY